MTSLQGKSTETELCSAPSGAFIEGLKGPLFTLSRGPKNAEDCTLIIPPFGEEMNRCRRLMNDLARALATQKHQAVILDLYATGESSGDLKDCRWQDWCADIRTVHHHVSAQGARRINFIAIRLGALLCLDALHRFNLDFENIHLIAPEFSAQRFFTQLFRSKIIADEFANSQFKRSSSPSPHPRDELLSQSSINVMGYIIPKALVDDAENALLTLSAFPNVHCHGRQSGRNAPKTWHQREWNGPEVWKELEPSKTKRVAKTFIDYMVTS